MTDEDPFLDKTEDTNGSFIELTVKGGQYQSHVVTVRKPTLAEVEEQLASAIRTVVGAQASLEKAIRENKPAPTAGTYGKPVGADTPSDNSLPFANPDSANSS
jgi:hypothetical protein